MRRRLHQAVTAAALLTLLVLCLLGQENFGSNEAGKLALALQQIRPDWNPNDWYLTTPQHYQWLFQQIAGQLLDHLGITWGSLAIRIAGYSLWSWAVAGLCIQMGLNPALSLGAVGGFLLDQSVISREWMIGGAEPKTFAYAALILAFSAWRRQQLWVGGYWSGLACSFHVLVGGYGSLGLAGLAWIRRRRQSLQPLYRLWIGLAIGLIPLMAALGIAILNPPSDPEAFSGQTLPESLSAAWIYTYLRNPHHLVPGSWSPSDWIYAVLWLGLFAAACWLVSRNGPTQNDCRQDLALWVTLSLIPFAVGLAISPWDHQGSWLRFYPFRVADSLLPLCTCLLIASEIQRRTKRIGSSLALVLAVIITTQQGTSWMPSWSERWASGFQANPEKQALYVWIKEHTASASTVMAPPSGFEDLALITGRAGVGQFKQIPNRSSDVQLWFRRMQDLSGNPDFWRQATGMQTRKVLVRGYTELKPVELDRLNQRFGSQIMILAKGQEAPAGWAEQLSTASWTLWTAKGDSHSSKADIEGSAAEADQSVAKPKPINN